MKPGWKTTEFWLAVATALGGLAAALADALPPKYAAAMAAAATFAYALARGLAKTNQQ